MAPGGESRCSNQTTTTTTKCRRSDEETRTEIRREEQNPKFAFIKDFRLHYASYLVHPAYNVPHTNCAPSEHWISCSQKRKGKVEELPVYRGYGSREGPMESAVAEDGDKEDEEGEVELLPGVSAEKKEEERDREEVDPSVIARKQLKGVMS